VKIQTERATPVIESVLAEWVFTVFLPKNGGYLFTGPYAVETFSKSDKVDLSPNQFYSNAERRPRVTIKKYADGSALATALEASEIDMAFHLPGDKIKALRENSNITIKSFPVEYMYMM
jgi:peptide/nickel transport system substrate-binding protein